MGREETTVVSESGETPRVQMRNDGGIWWTHLFGGCCSMETLGGEGEVGCSLCHIPVVWLQRGVGGGGGKKKKEKKKIIIIIKSN